MTPSETDPVKRTTRIFFATFVFACLLFWWLPSILFRLLGMEDPVHSWALWVSVVGLIAFMVGYFISPSRVRAFFEPLAHVGRMTFSPGTLDACESLAYKATVLLAIPALFLALRFFLYRLDVVYGQGEGIPFLYQVVLYVHLFLGFLFFGVARTIPQNKRRIVIACILVSLPRLIISLRWGRFFFAQAAIPIVLIALARGWVRLTGKRIILLGALAGFLIFVPALTRGNNFLGQDEFVSFFASGGSLRLFQDNVDLNLKGRCPPLLVSMTAKTIPYNLLGVCTIEFSGRTGMVATLDRILTTNDPSTEGTLYGTGSNYLLELYLAGGVTAIILGSVFFGFTSRCFVQWVGQRSAFAGIWAECLSRALFAPRGNLGYVYERIPSLVLATLLVLWLAWLAHARAEAGLSGQREAEWSR
ncbi:MAG: O-antigen polymerase [Candidatus Acidiferrales bacterium]